MDERIGTCSLCGGPVVVPSMMLFPVAHCIRCGAITKNPHGPVIEMDKPKRWPSSGAGRDFDEE